MGNTGPLCIREHKETLKVGRGIAVAPSQTHWPLHCVQGQEHSRTYIINFVSQWRHAGPINAQEQEHSIKHMTGCFSQFLLTHGTAAPAHILFTAKYSTGTPPIRAGPRSTLVGPDNEAASTMDRRP
eukprot:1161821-Pelagomonas_calceolata.AAC.21